MRRRKHAHPTVALRCNAEQHRYEALLDGQVAGHLDYRERGDVLELLHTEVDPVFEGRGVAAALTRQVLDEACRMHRKVVPRCPYVQDFIERHPQYAQVAVD